MEVTFVWMIDELTVVSFLWLISLIITMLYMQQQQNSARARNSSERQNNKQNSNVSEVILLLKSECDSNEQSQKGDFIANEKQNDNQNARYVPDLSEPNAESKSELDEIGTMNGESDRESVQGSRTYDYSEPRFSESYHVASYTCYGNSGMNSSPNYSRENDCDSIGTSQRCYTRQRSATYVVEQPMFSESFHEQICNPSYKNAFQTRIMEFEDEETGMTVYYLETDL